jgi:hypothetical protein
LNEANLESLQRQFLDKRCVAATRFLARSGEQAIARTLDSHLLREPSASAMRRRDELDYLLRYYSILELAAATGLVPRLPAPVKQQALAVLQQPSVQRYYQHYYPLLLPQLFLNRLKGRPWRAQGTDEGSLSKFIVIDSLRQTREVELFLWFLDDGYENGYGLADVFEVVKNGRRLAQTIARDPEESSSGDLAVIGFLEFLSFSRELKAFLDGLEDPLLRSAFWHFHGYWYDQIGGQVLGVLTAGIESLRRHVEGGEGVPPAATRRRGTPRNQVREARETNVSMDLAIRDLQVLTSAIYRYPLDAYILKRHAIVPKAIS